MIRYQQKAFVTFVSNPILKYLVTNLFNTKTVWNQINSAERGWYHTYSAKIVWYQLI